MKLLFWMVLFALVCFALRGKSRREHAAGHRGAAPPSSSEAMLQCRRCGVHFPASEVARNAHDEVFCSEEHRIIHGR